MKKLISLISYGNTERGNLFSTQPRSETLFDLESTCHPLGTLNMSFVFFEQLPNISKKAIYEKSNFAYFVR